MPRYHFNVTDGHGVTPDVDGQVFDDEESARREAAKSVRELLSSSDKQGRCRRHWRMDVRSQGGTLVFSLPFAHALQTDLIRVT